MARQNDKELGEFDAMLERLGSCTLAEIDAFLKDCSGTGLVALVVALVRLSSIEPRGPRPHSSIYEVPLNVLAKSPHRSAGRALLHVAAHAANVRVRMEAMRRLGGRADAKARELLRAVASDGFDAPGMFEHDSVPRQERQAAAVEALGQLKEPQQADVDAVMAAARAESGGSADSILWNAAIESLFAIARPGDIGPIADTAREAKNPLCSLDLLSVCSRFSTGELAAAREQLAGLMARGLHSFREGGDTLQQRLEDLGRKVVTPALLKVMPFGNDDVLERGRGAVCAAAVEAYGTADEVLTAAYLGFARSAGNVHRGSKCLLGLARCAREGHAKSIMAHVIRENHQGYMLLRTSGLLADVLGGMGPLVQNLCEALATIEERERGGTVGDCATCIVAASSAQAADLLRNRPLDQMRNLAAPLGELVEHLRTLGASDSGIAVLAAMCVRPEHVAGVVSLARSLLARQDTLMAYCREVLLAEAAALELSPGGSPDECSALRQLEQDLFPPGDRWEREHLADFGTIGDRINRYAFDLMLRREHAGLPDAAGRALRAARNADEIDFILTCLSASNTPGAAMAMAKAACYEGESRQFVSQVRHKALVQLGRMRQVLGQMGAGALGNALGAVHARFQDDKAVRKAAYSAAEAIADISSIAPLKERLAVDRDEDMRRAIQEALSAIGKRLSEEKPRPGTPTHLVTWLRSVADLGDPSFLADVLGFLSPPHSDEGVRIAALDCAAAIGDQATAERIRAFVEDTAPSGTPLAHARRAVAVLEGRKDTELLDALAELFGPGSPVAQLETDYTVLLGGARVVRLRQSLSDCARQLRDGHWNDLVTQLDGVCDMLVRHLYETRYDRMGLAEEKGKQMARQDYENRLRMSEFKNAFPELESLFLEIHRMRYESTTAHVEDSDGQGKPGVGEEDGRFTLDQFREGFRRYVAILQGT